MSFQGRADSLHGQHRINAQIARAADALVSTFGKGGDRDWADVADAGVEGSGDGAPPMLCTGLFLKDTLRTIFRSVGGSRSCALLTVSTDQKDLASLHAIVAECGYQAATAEESAATPRAVVIAPVDAVGGREFDVVIVWDFSSLPTSTLPESEWWRDAARAYAALTRARDVVFLMCSSPSPFVDTLLGAGCTLLNANPDLSFLRNLRWAPSASRC